MTSFYIRHEYRFALESAPNFYCSISDWPSHILILACDWSNQILTLFDLVTGICFLRWPKLDCFDPNNGQKMQNRS